MTKFETVHGVDIYRHHVHFDAEYWRHHQVAWVHWTEPDGRALDACAPFYDMDADGEPRHRRSKTGSVLPEPWMIERQYLQSTRTITAIGGSYLGRTRIEKTWPVAHWHLLTRADRPHEIAIVFMCTILHEVK